MKKNIKGLVLCLAIALPAWYLGSLFKVVGGPVFGILIGMLIALFIRPKDFEPGIQYTSKKILKYAIILLGFNMNLYHIFAVGHQTLVLMVFTLTATLLTATLMGKYLGLDGNTKTLIAVGTGICGGSAIAATAPIIGAKDEEVARAISTIFLFNVIAALIFPTLGLLLNMTDSTFGVWAGTAINDTSSVVAAGYSFSDAAGHEAVIVKLTRTLLIVPITLVLAIYTAKKQKNTQEAFSFTKVFPWFILGFIGASIANTYLPLPPALIKACVTLGKFAIVMAMSAIGLNTHLIKLIKKGLKPMLLGLTCWVVLSITSLLVQYTLL